LEIADQFGGAALGFLSYHSDTKPCHGMIERYHVDGALGENRTWKLGSKITAHVYSRLVTPQVEPEVVSGYSNIS
jgi:hypothetical protein